MLYAIEFLLLCSLWYNILIMKDFFKKKYNSLKVESNLNVKWFQNSLYKFSFTEDNNFVIDTPPPTISGSLHIGHVFSYTQSDFIVRYKRMKGFNVFYPIGFDDNGLATERFVEKKHSIMAHQVNKDEFVKLCRIVVEEEKKKFSYLLQQIGLSLDWNLVYNTRSEHSKKISQMSFIDLYNKGEVYRDTQPVIWDVTDQTALAQADLVDKEEESYMHQIKFDTSLNQEIVIATTRPELLPACLAIFVHPEDLRFRKFIGHKAFIPLFKKAIEVIADDLVEQNKGTGAVMCCSFGDQTDLIWCRKHNLNYQTIIETNGLIKIQIDFDSDSAKYYANQLNGLTIKEARNQILEFLRNHYYLKDSKKILHVIKTAERSGTAIEFILFTQWFIHTVKHKDSLLKLSSQLNWHPVHMKVKLDAWISSIVFDWCISRQRVFGVPFPVWYSKRKGEEGRVILAKIDQLPIDPQQDLPEGYTREEVIADLDVMDTWATSSVSPQINASGISSELCLDPNKYRKIFPSNLRSQAHEIIRTWAFYSILKSFLHESKLPWKDIMISGWCLANDKTKMSKSKGNIIEPEFLIQKYGADSIRYWSGLAKTGMDTVFSIDVIQNGKKFLNKLWSVANFINGFLENYQKLDIKNYKDFFLNEFLLYDTDVFIINKIYDLEVAVREDFENYKYYAALHRLEKFFFQGFCDYYIEIIKRRVYKLLDEKKNTESLSALNSILYVFENVLKMLAPFFPYISEEIFQNLYQPQYSIHAKNSWPSNLLYFNKTKIDIFLYLKEIIDSVRIVRSKNNLALNSPISSVLIMSKLNKVRKYFSDQICFDLKNVLFADQVLFSEKESLDIEYTISSTNFNIKLDF